MEFSSLPSSPRDPRHPEIEPGWKTFDIGVEGERPTQHAHRVETLLRSAAGVKEVAAHPREARVTITSDFRVTNPPAIRDTPLAGGCRAAAHNG